MKLFKLKLLIIVIAFPLMSCVPEIAPPASEQEIVNEISRTWTSDMTEDGFPYQEFESTISNDSSGEGNIFISNFHNSGSVVSAVVSKDLTIDIPEQTIGEQTFKGSGDILNDYSEIRWEYTIENSDGTVQVSGKYTYGSPA